MDFEAKAKEIRRIFGCTCETCEKAGVFDPEKACAEVAAILRSISDTAGQQGRHAEQARLAATVRIIDLAGDGTGPWRLQIDGHGIADWPCTHEPVPYALEVARCVREALGEKREDR